MSNPFWVVECGNQHFKTVEPKTRKRSIEINVLHQLYHGERLPVEGEQMPILCWLGRIIFIDA
jgi:hypothetical protein